MEWTGSFLCAADVLGNECEMKTNVSYEREKIPIHPSHPFCRRFFFYDALLCCASTTLTLPACLCLPVYMLPRSALFSIAFPPPPHTNNLSSSCPAPTKSRPSTMKLVAAFLELLLSITTNSPR